MKLSKLLENAKVVKICGNADCEIKEITCDSSTIVKDCLFICITGDNYDGHCFIRQAELYGAKAIICEKEVNTTLTQVIVEDSRVAMSFIASNFYNNPSDKMKIVGITGTNGKTTTSKIIAEILDYAGIKCGIIGTLGAIYNNKTIDCKLTTPDPITLNKILCDMANDGVEVVVMEVSAHASFYDKIKCLNFDVAIFTNLSQDHLDFFGSMENYAQAKSKFFLENAVKYSVVNVDDPFGRDLSKNLGNCITYGIDNPSDIFAIKFISSKAKTTFVINLFDCVSQVNFYLKGLFNVYNALAGVTAVCLLGIEPKTAIKGLERVKSIPGRLEEVYNDRFSVFVDYAHTPDGLEKTLFTLKTICKGRLICLFGCGGNRDKAKRPIMGEISGKIANFTIITTDNPRYEEPMDIISEIETGVIKHTKNYVIVLDREQAIKYALDMAKENDLILIAGKGNEKYQDVLGIKKPFDDNATIKEILQRKGL